MFSEHKPRTWKGALSPREAGKVFQNEVVVARCGDNEESLDIARVALDGLPGAIQEESQEVPRDGA